MIIGINCSMLESLFIYDGEETNMGISESTRL